MYVDEKEDAAMAEEITLNAKVQRPGVCNAMETLLVHASIAPTFLPKLTERLKEHRVEIRGDEAAGKILGAAVKRATDADYATEYNDFIMNLRVVDGLGQAIEHINRELGTLAVIITHNAILADMADRVLSMRDGRIVSEHANARREPVRNLRW